MITSLSLLRHLYKRVKSEVQILSPLQTQNTTQKKNFFFDLKYNSPLVNRVPWYNDRGGPQTMQSYNPFRGLHLIKRGSCQVQNVSTDVDTKKIHKKQNAISSFCGNVGKLCCTLFLFVQHYQTTTINIS